VVWAAAAKAGDEGAGVALVEVCSEVVETPGVGEVVVAWDYTAGNEGYSQGCSQADGMTAGQDSGSIVGYCEVPGLVALEHSGEAPGYVAADEGADLAPSLDVERQVA
jgi:hypothetical protein